MTLRIKELGIGLAVLALAALLLLWLIPEGIPQPSRLREGQLSPRFWPLVSTALLVVSGLVLAATAWFEPSVAEDNDGDGEAPLPRRQAVVGLLIGCLLLAAYYWAMMKVGMVLASAAGILALGYAYGERRFQVLLPVALLLPAGLYLFFVYVAGIPIPDPLVRTLFRSIF